MFPNTNRHEANIKKNIDLLLKYLLMVNTVLKTFKLVFLANNNVGKFNCFAIQILIT